MKTPKLCRHGVGTANLPGAATNPSTMRVPNDSANTSITWIVSDRAIGIKLKEAMGRGGPTNMHGGLKGGVVLRRKGEMKVGGDGVDFFEGGVAVKLDSLHDRLVSREPDRPSRNGEKGRPGSDAWVWDKLEGRCHTANLVEG